MTAAAILAWPGVLRTLVWYERKKAYETQFPNSDELLHIVFWRLKLYKSFFGSFVGGLFREYRVN